jgi:uncharacterized phage protein gp47/JayE
MATIQWGLTDTGFFRPRLPEIVAELDARWKSRFGADRPTHERSIDGKIIRWGAETMALGFEAAEGAYQGGHLDTSSGLALDLVVGGLGFARNPATYSTVTLTLGGTPATVIPAGSIITSTTTTKRWTTDAEATIGGGGTIDVAATAEETGPIAQTAGSNWTITTPVVGWSTVTNALDAEEGDDEETDAELRQRVRTATAAGGLKAALLVLEGVTAVTIFENDTDTPDATYGATHWVEALVVGGEDQEIVDTIADENAPGIGTQGDSSGVETVTGNGETISFSRGTEVDVWIIVNITAGSGFSGNATEIRNGIVAWADANHAYGDDVAPALLAAQIPGFTSGAYSVEVLVGEADPPVSAAILTIDDREIARFDTTRTTVNIA